MTAIQLYKFIYDNELEWHSEYNRNKEDVLLLVNIYQIREFNELLSSGILDEEGMNCIMKEGYFCFWMNDICEYFGINIEEIFTPQIPKRTI